MAKNLIDLIYHHRNWIAGGTAACLSLYALRRYFAGGVCTSTKRLDGKTVIVTGANSGIGRETARDLARRGARVIIASRDVLKGERVAAEIVEQTGSKNVVVQQLDLASLESIRKFAERIKSQESRLDILINNAGVMACPEWKTKDGFEMQFGTNHIGHFLLTNLLLDMLKQSTPSRIINVSSKIHYMGKINFDNLMMENIYDPWKAYAQSKLANVLFTKELARRLKDDGVTVCSLHPGVIMTNLGRHILFKMPLYKKVPAVIFSPLFLKNSVEGAQTTLHCALTDDLVNGAYYSDCVEKEPAVQAQSYEDSRKLWTISEEMVGLK